MGSAAMKIEAILRCSLEQPVGYWQMEKQVFFSYFEARNYRLTSHISLLFDICESPFLFWHKIYIGLIPTWVISCLWKTHFFFSFMLQGTLNILIFVVLIYFWTSWYLWFWCISEHHICGFDILLKEALIKLEVIIFKGKNNHRHPICHHMSLKAVMFQRS